MSKKTNGKARGLVILIIIIIAAVILLIKLGILDFKGFGKGGSDGDAIQVNATLSDTVSETTEETTAETTVQETTFVNITIDGEKYIYNNQSCEINKLIEELSKAEGSFEVHILLGETATLAAREKLESRLDENKIIYSVVEN